MDHLKLHQCIKTWSFPEASYTITAAECWGEGGGSLYQPAQVFVQCKTIYRKDKTKTSWTLSHCRLILHHSASDPDIHTITATAIPSPRSRCTRAPAPVPCTCVQGTRQSFGYASSQHYPSAFNIQVAKTLDFCTQYLDCNPPKNQNTSVPEKFIHSFCPVFSTHLYNIIKTSFIYDWHSIISNYIPMGKSCLRSSKQNINLQKLNKES